MDVRVTAGCLFHAIAAGDISQSARQATEEFQELVTGLLTDFASSAPSPQKALNLENALYDRLRQLGQQLIQWLLSQLEPDPDAITLATYKRGWLISPRRVRTKTIPQWSMQPLPKQMQSRRSRSPRALS